MGSESKKTVLVGITGCIAAYKSCEIIRALQKQDVHVKVVMTEHATQFVNPLTFRALTHEPVAVGLFDNPQDPIHHISLAQEADVFLIAPCTANVLAKLTYGLADDLLTTTALATTAPVMVAPAMNAHMYEHPATQHNMQLLKERGVEFIEASSGYLACGEVGQGRLADPYDIAGQVLDRLEDGKHESSQSSVKDLEGLTIMVTAGPTVEPIDPVRFLSNRSSGKFGYAIARAAAERGARVLLVSGPVALTAPPGAEVLPVQTAREMLEAATKAFKQSNIGIFTAAVADYRPATIAENKLKKGINDADLRSIALIQNPDILSELAHRKNHQVVVGFAAETTNVVEHAKKKLISKQADMIVANEVGADKTFGKDEDEIWLVTKQGCEHKPCASKAMLAHDILDKAHELFLQDALN